MQSNVSIFAKVTSLGCIGFIFVCSNIYASSISGDYLGQKKPGLTPKVFGPELISMPKSDDTASFSPDMQAFYVNQIPSDSSSQGITNIFQRTNDEWDRVQILFNEDLPAFSPDGKMRYYGTQFQVRNEKGWSDLETLGPGFEKIQAKNISVADSGTLVMDEVPSEEGDVVMRFSRLINGKRESPQPLPRGINFGKRNANPFIAPDESYILWDGERRSGFGKSDIYVSFKQADGSWSEAFNLGAEINTASAESRPIVSPDGEFLFFNREIELSEDSTESHLDLFWVDASVIDKIRLRENDNISPEATEKEAPIVYWAVPAIKRHFFQLPPLAKPYVAIIPSDRNDGFLIGELGEDGGNKEKLLKTIKEISEDPANQIDSILAVKSGKLIFESYMERGRIDLPHPQSSAVKSYTSMALGRAIQLGYLGIEDLDKPITSFFDKLEPTRFASGVERITLRRALNMRSGLRIEDEVTQMLHSQPAMIKGQKEVQELFERTAPIDAISEREFSYGNFSSHLVMQVIDAVTPNGAEKFIREELLAPLGIKNFAWQLGPAGLPEGGWRVGMTSRDMAKIGTVVLNNGKWNGEQLISEAYINEAISRQVSLSDEQVERFYTGNNLSNAGYGFFWWIMDMQVGDTDKIIHSKSVQGGGGMTIQVIEELDLVLVITAHSPFSYSQFIAEHILPAFMDD